MYMRIWFIFSALLGLITLPSYAAVASDGQPVIPVFSPPGGVYNTSQTVKITDATPGVSIYFTTDGDAPKISSAKYTAPILVSESLTIRAYAVTHDGAQSEADSATYHLLASVLHRLDLASTNFRSTSADVQIDVVTQYPVPDTDTQKGVVYYQRKGTAFQMAAHIAQDNGQPPLSAYRRAIIKVAP